MSHAARLIAERRVAKYPLLSGVVTLHVSDELEGSTSAPTASAPRGTTLNEALAPLGAWGRENLLDHAPHA